MEKPDRQIRRFPRTWFELLYSLDHNSVEYREVGAPEPEGKYLLVKLLRGGRSSLREFPRTNEGLIQPVSPDIVAGICRNLGISPADLQATERQDPFIPRTLAQAEAIAACYQPDSEDAPWWEERADEDELNASVEDLLGINEAEIAEIEREIAEEESGRALQKPAPQKPQQPGSKAAASPPPKNSKPNTNSKAGVVGNSGKGDRVPPKSIPAPKKTPLSHPSVRAASSSTPAAPENQARIPWQTFRDFLQGQGVDVIGPDRDGVFHLKLRQEHLPVSVPSDGTISVMLAQTYCRSLGASPEALKDFLNNPASPAAGEPRRLVSVSPAAVTAAHTRRRA